MRVLSFRDIFFFTVMDTVGRCYCYSICVIPPARGTVDIFPKSLFTNYNAVGLLHRKDTYEHTPVVDMLLDTKVSMKGNGKKIDIVTDRGRFLQKKSLIGRCREVTKCGGSEGRVQGGRCITTQFAAAL